MRILYVEDDAGDADLTAQLLLSSMPQVRIETSTTLTEALARLERLEAEPLDLVLTDVRLPDGDGLALLAHIRTQALSLPVVVITGNGDEETAVAALKAGADDYVVKRKGYLDHLPLNLENALHHYRTSIARTLRPLRLLYAEHDPNDADLTLHHFSNHARHFQIDLVSTGMEALQRLQNRTGQDGYDILLLDYNLPGLDTLELLKELRRALRSDIPVVLVAGQGSEEVALQALKLGASSYIIKNPGYLYKLPVELENELFRVELLQREKVLRDSEERNRAILSAIPDMMFLQTRDGIYLDYHANDPNLLLLTPDQFLGKKMEEVLPPDLVSALHQCFERALETNEAQVHEYSLPIQGELHWFECRIARSGGNKLLSIVRDITGRRRTEQAIRFQAGILNTIEQAVIATNLNGEVMYWNQFAERLYGWSMYEAVGQKIQNLLKSEMLKDQADEIWSRLRRGESWAGEWTLRHRDGRILPVWVSDSPIYDDRGTIIGIIGISHDITNSKKDEEALRKSEERYRNVVETQSDLICRYLPDTSLTFVNDAYCRYFGRAREELIGSKFILSIPPQTRAAVLRHIEPLIRKAGTETHEHEVILRDGAIGWQRWTNRSILTESGELLEIQGVGRDITEQKRAEKARKENEQQLRLFVEHAPVAVAMFDREMRYMLASRRWLKDNHLIGADIIGHNHYELVPNIPERWKEGHKRCLAGAVESCEEDIFEHPDGTTDWVRWEVRPWYAAGGEIGGLIMFSEMITERKRAAEALRASEERFAKVFKANPQPMSLTTFDDGIYLDVNESLLNLSGYTREEIIGRSSLEIGFWDTPADRGDVLGRLEQQGTLSNVETTFHTKSGATRVLLSSVELVDIEGRRCILIASSDITERKKLEEDLLRLTLRLFTLQDEERRRIARELHDVTAQNLFAISINLSRLQQLSALGAKERQVLDESLALAEQALTEIRTLSYLLHPPLLDQAGLFSALQWYVEGFTKRSGIYVDLIVLEDIGRMPSEIETALFRVVQEGLTNIHRHSGSDTASIRLEKKNGSAVLQIKDQGWGMRSEETPASAELISELGVGIPGMRQRMLQLGGLLEVESDEQGTTITASVPIKQLSEVLV